MMLFPWWIKYPNVNNEIQNLDWLIYTVKHLAEEIKNFINLNTIKYADPILWDITSQYEANTIVVDPQTGDAYISTKPVPYGVSLDNTNYWTKIYNYADAINKLEEQIAAANEGLSTTATAPRLKGELVWLNGLLYKVTANMIAGDTYVVGSNCEKTTIEEELKLWVDDLEEKIGKLSDLNTTDKDNLVAAINEVLSSIGNLASLTTTDKSNIVAAINEVVSNVSLISEKVELNSIYENVVKYGAIGDGVEDDTQAIKDAITASVQSKKPVYFPQGNYRITSTINLPEGITLMGKESSFSAWDDSIDLYSCIFIDTPISSTYSAFTVCYGVKMVNLKFYWVQNVVGATPKDYGPLVSSTADAYGTDIMADCTFENLLLENASRGFYAKTGGRNVFSNIKADVSEFFVNMDQQRDSDYFDNIHIFPFASTTDSVRMDYVFDNCNAFIFTNCDDMHMSNVLILRTRRGLLLQADSVLDPADYGAWVECTNVSFDGTKEECVYAAFPKYVNLVNCRFVGTAGYSACIFLAAQTQSKVQITSCSFWFADYGVINHGCKLELSNCTCEGNIACILQENSITSNSKISNCDLYGNDNYNIPANAELNGQKLKIGSSTSYPDLVALNNIAVQTAIPTKYDLQILEFKTADNGYGVININTDGATPAQTIKFNCNGDYVHIPIISKLFLTAPNVQIIYQPESASGGTISEIKIYDTEGCNDTIISEYKLHESALPAYICDSYLYDGKYHAEGVTNTSISADLFKKAATLSTSSQIFIKLDAVWLNLTPS